jgi:Zn-dependent peptidase ImmA (M78 family)
MLLQERIANARLEARNLHRRFGVESVAHVDVYGFAERLRVQLVDAPLDGALAQLIVNRRRTRILLSYRLVDPAMRRVAVAHELGHYLLRHPTPALDELNACRSSRAAPFQVCSPGQPREFEHEAHSFGLELLTPTRTVEQFRGRVPDLAVCGELAMLAWVPIDYAAIRIAETSDRICAVVLSDHTGILWVAQSRRFVLAFGKQHRLREGQTLDSRTLASRMIDRGSPFEPAFVPAEAWLGDIGLPLLESSTPVGLRGGVLTVLWAGALETALLAPSSRLTH